MRIKRPHFSSDARYESDKHVILVALSYASFSERIVQYIGSASTKGFASRYSSLHYLLGLRVSALYFCFCSRLLVNEHWLAHN